MKQPRTANGKFASKKHVMKADWYTVDFSPEPSFTAYKDRVTAMAGIQVVLLSFLLGYLVAVTF